MKKTFISLICLIITVLIFTSCSPFQKVGTNDSNDEILPASSVAISEGDAEGLNNKMPVRLYYGVNNSKGIGMEIRYLPLENAGKDIKTLATVVVKELLKGPQDKKKHSVLVPKGTRVLSDVDVKSGIATINLSKEFIENQMDDKSSARLTLYSIVNSITEISEISEVIFLIEGKKIKDYKGSFKLDRPFPRNNNLLPRNLSTNEKPEIKPSMSNITSESDEDIILQPYE